MRAAVFVLVATACDPSRSTPPPESRRSIDATTLRASLKCAHDTPPCDHHIHDIRIEPLGRHAARYIVHRADRKIEDEADAEFPGNIVDEIKASGLPYKIVPPLEGSWPHSDRDMRARDADSLRHDLASLDEAIKIEKIMIEPLDGDTARYIVTYKTTNRRDVVTAPFPGPLPDEIYAAGIAYGVRASSD
jgi:hypothetical protein